MGVQPGQLTGAAASAMGGVWGVGLQPRAPSIARQPPHAVDEQLMGARACPSAAPRG